VEQAASERRGLPADQPFNINPGQRLARWSRLAAPDLQLDPAVPFGPQHLHSAPAQYTAHSTTPGGMGTQTQINHF